MRHQQTTQPQPPTAPPSSAARPTGVSIGGTTVPLEGRILTAADVRALRSRRAELSNQLESVSERREVLLRDLQRNRLPEVARVGIEQRLSVLDSRIVEIEQQIAENGRLLANAPVGLAGQTEVVPPATYGPFTSKQLTAISIIGITTVGLPLAAGAAWLMIKRAQRPRPTPQAIESTERLARLEQAIDAVAVEVERISEGQRFVTRVLSNGERGSEHVIGTREP